MNRTLLWLAVAATLAMAPQGSGQSVGGTGEASSKASTSPLPVTAAGAVESQFTGPIFGRAKCDEDGNLYLRAYTQERVFANTVHQAPIQKIKADGAMAETFTISDFSTQFWAKDFFVTGDGRVFQIAYSSKPEFYVFEFSGDGSLKTKTSIATESFSPYQIAVFKSGEFLLSGTSGKEDHTPFTGVFASSGKLIKKITVPKDAESAASAEAGDSNSAASHGQVNLAVVYGEAVAVSDGNIYLMRSGSRAWVHAVSPSGDVVRSFYVDSGDTGRIAVAMKSAPGRLVLAFRQNNVAGVLLKVVDLEGNPIADFASSESKFPAAFLACYLPPSFVFAQSDARGPLHLQKAEPR